MLCETLPYKIDVVIDSSSAMYIWALIWKSSFYLKNLSFSSCYLSPHRFPVLKDNNSSYSSDFHLIKDRLIPYHVIIIIVMNPSPEKNLEGPDGSMEVRVGWGHTAERKTWLREMAGVEGRRSCPAGGELVRSLWGVDGGRNMLTLTWE